MAKSNGEKQSAAQIKQSIGPQLYGLILSELFAAQKCRYSRDKRNPIYPFGKLDRRRRAVYSRRVNANILGNTQTEQTLEMKHSNVIDNTSVI